MGDLGLKFRYGKEFSGLSSRSLKSWYILSERKKKKKKKPYIRAAVAWPLSINTSATTKLLLNSLVDL